ncbi:MAG TPA: sugar phosphate isomerase/epimerase [Bacteroidales bacterium]|nr:sugar phosphate isomerase/epimerase [Bacteroidales bacterium]HPJ59058.1 sugar phosphate isomerase/epimerase [Bacteroidales bacterium]HPR13168.1 sugar phosphate isomerase/epimerase [Bacteroidales bacterium]HRW84748.1 sugar phosphate isomerase/epimerase [Bacteroidales bacterium]
MITRRKFISKAAIAACAAMLSPDLFALQGKKKLENFGFISGIIGKELKEDWKGALKKAASFGYTEIETGNYMGESAEEFLSYLRETELKLVAGGFEFKSSDEDLKKSLDLLTQLKVKIAVVYWPWYTGGPFRLADCKQSAERLNYLGKVCKEKGLEFSWHNHDKEFIPMEEGLPFDYLMKNTDPSLVKCELDIYWAAKGGADPVELMKKYSGRYNILHIKDMAPGSTMDFECPGSGIIDFSPVFREAYSQGIRHFMVERDNVTDGIACLKSAAEYLDKLRY